MDADAGMKISLPAGSSMPFRLILQLNRGVVCSVVQGISHFVIE